MPLFRIAKAKVASSNLVFRSNLPGIRDVSGSGLFHGRRLARRSRWFTTVGRRWYQTSLSEGLRMRSSSCGQLAARLWNIGGTFGRVLFGT
jgi:hypothetical protein